LDEVLSHTYWIEQRGNSWVVGSFNGPSITVQLPADSDLRTASGFVFGGSRQNDRWGAVTVNPQTGDVATVAELGKDEVPIDWAISPSGATIYVSLGTGAPRTDLGVISLDVATGRHALLIPPDSNHDQVRGLALSVSGLTLAAPHGCQAIDACFVDVLDLAHRELTKSVGLLFVQSLDDQAILGDTAGAEVDVRPWKVLTLSDATIAGIAKDTISRTSERYALSDGRFLLSGTLDDRQYNIVLVDLAAGSERLILSQTGEGGSLQLRSYLHSDRWALLSDMSWEAGQGGTLRVLDIQTGRVLDRIVNPEP